jgi:hypothetical protein
MPYAIALEDSLCGAWHAFKRGQTVDNRKIENLLRMYKPPHITNTQQLQRLDIIDAPLMMQLAQAGLQTQTVPELAVLTRYKIVLSETSTTFPHINIYGDALGNHYAMTCQMGQQRHKALAHLSALLANANSVLIHDRHLAKTWPSAKQILSLLPHKQLTLFFTTTVPQAIASEIKNTYALWTVKPSKASTYQQHHDRYLRIDNQIEVVITSGIDYLFDASKECTLLIRSIQ